MLTVHIPLPCVNMLPLHIPLTWVNMLTLRIQLESTCWICTFQWCESTCWLSTFHCRESTCWLCTFHWRESTCWLCAFSLVTGHPVTGHHLYFRGWQGRDLYPGQSDWLARDGTCDWPPGVRWRNFRGDVTRWRHRGDTWWRHWKYVKSRDTF